MERCTKIVATLGPASQDEQTIRELIRAGMNVARLNFSHGSYTDHAIRIERIRRISKELGQPVTILQDLQGPKIRTGEIAGGSVQLLPGQALTLTTEPMIGDQKMVSVDYPGLPASVKPGSRILLDDGNLELSVTAVNKDRVETLVSLGGALKSHKGVNLPGGLLEIPGFTQKDEDDLAFGLEQGVDKGVHPGEPGHGQVQ